VLDDGDAIRGELGAEMGGKAGVELDGKNVGCTSGESAGDGACAGADFDDGAAGDIAERGSDALDGLRVVKEVLTEFGFGGHGLVRC